MKKYWSVIRNESAYNAALKRIQEIFHAKEGDEDYEELELLVLLVEQYEAKHFDIPQADPIEIIEFIMEQRELRQVDLVGILGDKANVSKILHRKRPLTLEMIRKFSKAFDIPASVLISEYELV